MSVEKNQKELFDFVFMQVIRHDKLNLPNKPCEASADYNFGHCVDRSVITWFGCQPPWRRVDVKDLPICDNSMILQQYSHYYIWLMTMGRDELIQNTKCLMPCSFMEYKVAMAMYYFFLNVTLFKR